MMWSTDKMTPEKVLRYTAIAYGLDIADLPTKKPAEPGADASDEELTHDQLLTKRVNANEILTDRRVAMKQEAATIRSLEKELKAERDRRALVRRNFRDFLNNLEEEVVIASLGDGLANNQVQLNNLPTLGSAEYTQMRIYRTAAGGSSYFRLATVDLTATTSYTDVNSGDINLTQSLNETTLSGSYGYLVSWANANSESRPTAISSIANVIDGRIHLQNLPTPLYQVQVTPFHYSTRSGSIGPRRSTAPAITGWRK
jgi:hypothetical protein